VQSAVAIQKGVLRREWDHQPTQWNFLPIFRPVVVARSADVVELV
jgi:hypothetical protein